MPAIRCAHCRDRHASVAQVRLCAERQRRVVTDENLHMEQFAAPSPSHPDPRVLAVMSDRYRVMPPSLVPHRCEDLDGECAHLHAHP